jgi:bacterioferritin (cytochrome b1)
MAPTMPQRAPGLRGAVAFRLKRLVRRVTYWYVEPRMEAQREIDAEVARFATDTCAELDAAQQEIERLVALVGRLHLQVAELAKQGEQVNRIGQSP